VADLLRAQQEDHGDDDRAELQDGAVRVEHLGAIGEHHDDAVARADPEAAERVREPAGRPLLVHVRPLAPLEVERDVLREAPDVLLAEPGQVHVRDSTSW